MAHEQRKDAPLKTSFCAEHMSRTHAERGETYAIVTVHAAGQGGDHYVEFDYGVRGMKEESRELGYFRPESLRTIAAALQEAVAEAEKVGIIGPPQTVEEYLAEIPGRLARLSR